MISYTIELNSKPVKGTNEHKLMLKITYKKERARIALDYSVQKRQFNPNPKQNQYIRRNHPRYATINRDIDDKIQHAKDTTKTLEKEKKLVSAKSIIQRIRQTKAKSLFDFADKLIGDLKRHKKIGNFKKYEVVYKSLKAFKENDDLTFQEIDFKFLTNYQSYLESKGKSQNTIHGYLRKVRAIYYRSIDEGLIDQSNNPFFSFKLKQGSVNRVRLNEEEIKLIEELELLKGGKIWHVRNAFLFSFYNAGIRASDLIMLKWSNIQNGRLVYQMYKTKKPYTIKLKEKPLEILKYYKSYDPDNYIFSFFRKDIDYSDPTFFHNQISAKTALINKYLKDIANRAGIKKKISTHTARHSFADIARKKKVNLYDLSKTLGHSNLKITEAYLASFDEEAVDSTLDEVFD